MEVQGIQIKTNPTITFYLEGKKHYPKMINNLGDVSVNFGQQGFTYTPPTGFKALNSKKSCNCKCSWYYKSTKTF